MPVTPKGIRTPAGYEKVDGAGQLLVMANSIDQAIENLAKKVEARLARLPFAMAAGQAYVNATVSKYLHDVKFPAGRFTKPPRVTVQLVTGAGDHKWSQTKAISITTVGFQLFTNPADGTQSAMIFDWIAVQPEE